MTTLRRSVTLLLVGLTLGVTACSYRDSRPMIGPDGQQWLAVTCSHGADNCWQEAADRCPHGYVTANDNQAMTSGVVASEGTAVSFPQQRGQMLIRCNPAPVAAAR